MRERRVHSPARARAREGEPACPNTTTVIPGAAQHEWCAADPEPEASDHLDGANCALAVPCLRRTTVVCTAHGSQPVCAAVRNLSVFRPSTPACAGATAMAPTRDELSPRLPRGQLRRRREARRALAPHRAAEGEGDGVPRHRHPRRNRPLRPLRRPGDAGPRNGRPASAAFSAHGSLPISPLCSRPTSPRSRRRRRSRRALPRTVRPASTPARHGSRAISSGRRTGSPPSSCIRRTPPRSPRLFAGDRQVKVIALDGWTALGAFVPPKERRGLVLIDPPFEERDEFDRLLGGLVKAHRRWPTGIYALWYPVKDLAATKRFRAGLAESRAAAAPARRAHHPQARRRRSSPAPASSSPTRPGASKKRYGRCSPNSYRF